jgi:ribosomal protein L6P/L9E
MKKKYTKNLIINGVGFRVIPYNYTEFINKYLNLENIEYTNLIDTINLKKQTHKEKFFLKNFKKSLNSTLKSNQANKKKININQNLYLNEIKKNQLLNPYYYLRNNFNYKHFFKSVQINDKKIQFFKSNQNVESFFNLNNIKFINKDQYLFLIFKLGFSHDIIFIINTTNKNINIECINKNKIKLTSSNLKQLSQIAAEIKRLKKVEPYKQKGIFYENEFIFKKENKK